MKSPIPLREIERSATEVERAVTLPAAAYTSRELYEFELDAIWDRGWICLSVAVFLDLEGGHDHAEPTITTTPEPELIAA